MELKDGKIMYGTITFFFLWENNIYIYFKEFSTVHNRMIYHRLSGVVMKNILPIEEKNMPQIVSLQKINAIYPILRVGDYICKRPHYLIKNL